MWALEHSLQFFGLATSVKMTASILSSASSALLPTFPIQLHGGNTAFHLPEGQSAPLSTR